MSSILEDLGFDLSDAELSDTRSAVSKTLTGIGAVLWFTIPLVLWVQILIANVYRPLPSAIAQTPTVQTTAQTNATPETEDVQGQPRLLKLAVTLNHPADLKVKQGDAIKSGQPIADRAQERLKAIAQKREYEVSLARLQLKSAPPVSPQPVPKPMDLPIASDAEELAGIESAQLKVQEVEQKLAVQSIKIEELTALDEEDLPDAVMPHEQARSEVLEQDLQEAKAQLNLAQAKWQNTKYERRDREYQHRQNLIRYQQEQNQVAANYQRALAEYHRQEQDRQFQIAALREKIAAVDTQIQQLSVVRSPYAGEIRRVKFVGQDNHQLNVELLLAASPARSPDIRLR